jgi:lipid II isoglutaminyl synthase (glutamine-hydrolysing)
MGSSQPVRAYDEVVRRLALAARAAARVTRTGAGTSLPGLLIQKLDPGFVERRAARLGDGVAVVSGTNGKTTTAAMIAAILTAEEEAVVANGSGANLFRGIAATLATTPPSARAGVFEVDEGALARLVPALRPRVLVLTNVFRDQLDRFGEPETVARLLGDAARSMPEGGIVVANADDPLLWDSVADARPVGYGVVAPEDQGEAWVTTDAEPEVCPRCGGALTYRRRSIGHIGAASCARCGWASPDPPFLASVAAGSTFDSLSFRLRGIDVEVGLGGLHNAYNATAAIAACDSLGIPPERAAAALRDFSARFGRTERLDVGGRRVWLLLMKNPAGASVLVRQVISERSVGAVVVMLNDRYADGRDVSWIWDANLEPLVRRGLPVVAGGIRAADVAVRVKYAGGEAAAVETDPLRALAAAGDAASGGDAAVLATYSAMLDLRAAVLGSRVGRVAEVAG